MKLVETQKYASESASLKNENCLLWIAVVVLSLNLIYSERQYDRLQAKITEHYEIKGLNK